ncbi:hypothetical protein OJ253_1433 [Cryptosporidium canis]|uniref:CWF21 domain-containing protein n=1 Tax=Cryptosporidium canis TaxID=195482 RepID=A0A9D5DGX0_9CRYT|nr:hypothetical protein OJ253_1433 [Cryptosporidium canis]
MYNGVGLRTARGSGTSGHVQKNLSAIAPKQWEQKRETGPSPGPVLKLPKIRMQDPGLARHEALRKIELELLQLTEELESKGVKGADLEAAVDKRRMELASTLGEAPAAEGGAGSGGGTGGGDDRRPPIWGDPLPTEWAAGLEEEQEEGEAEGEEASANCARRWRRVRPPGISQRGEATPTWRLRGIRATEPVGDTSTSLIPKEKSQWTNPSGLRLASLREFGPDDLVWIAFPGLVQDLVQDIVPDLFINLNRSLAPGQEPPGPDLMAVSPRAAKKKQKTRVPPGTSPD